MSERASERPTREDLDRILERTRERVEALLRRHQCTRPVAMGVLREAMAELARRWGELRDRDGWFVHRVEEAVRHAQMLSFKEPLDDEGTA